MTAAFIISNKLFNTQKRVKKHDLLPLNLL